MAKWKFDDYANAAMAVVAVVYFGAAAYQGYKQTEELKETNAADRYVREATARMKAMHDYILQQRGSKQAYKEAFEAAKNRVHFEAREVLGENPYVGQAVKRVHAAIDQMIKENV